MAGKADIVSVMAEKAGITKKEAAAAYDAFVDHVTSTCKGGDRCSVPGLGTFNVTTRKSRKGLNPRTKEPITIPSSRGVRFKAGKDLREAVNKKKKSK